MIEETAYFDRDYLSEYSAYYGTCVGGYGNVCRRLHFFTEDVDEEKFQAAQGGTTTGHDLQDSYRGFLVWRPLPFAPLGRTVLRWYPGEVDGPPGIIAPVRDYLAHVGGIELSVKGLAWQQQDTAVSRCATIALWSMLHSSGFDEHHAVPTTAAVSMAAFQQVSLGRPPFHGDGLTTPQMCGAVSALGFSPVVVPGDHLDDAGKVLGFSPDRFAEVCSTFVVSGYTIVLTGRYENSRTFHSVCLVGYFPDTKQGIEAVYLHDDNLGPAARFLVTEEALKDSSGRQRVLLRRAPPAILEKDTDPVADFPSFLPLGVIIAVHPEIRTSPAQLWRLKDGITKALATKLKTVQVGARFMRAGDYLGQHLDRLLKGPQRGRARQALSQLPLSLFILVIRASVATQTGTQVPVAEWLYDTTAGAHAGRSIACVATHAKARAVLGSSIIDPFR